MESLVAGSPGGQALLGQRDHQPYLCLGVGLSYASGVAVMLPVMKIFVSAEGAHGWAERTAAEKRLNVTFLNFDVTVGQNQRKPEGDPIALVVHELGSTAPPSLRPVAIERSSLLVNKSIVRVKGVIDGKVVESRNWLGTKNRPGMVAILALADAGQPLELDVQGPAGRGAALPPSPATAPAATAEATTPATTVPATVPAAATTVTITAAITPHDLSWYYRPFLRLVQSLPDDKFQSLAWIVGFFIGLCVIGRSSATGSSFWG